MKHSSADLGLITTLLDRFTNQRLPRLLEMKSRLDKGDKLDDRDLDLLQSIQDNFKKNQTLIDSYPQLESIVAKSIGLYSEITSRALENEQGG